MFFGSLFFLLGHLSLYLVSDLPKSYVFLIAFVVLIGGQFFKNKQRFRFLINALQCCILGFCWIFFFSWYQHLHALDKKEEGVSCVVQGYVSSIPQVDHDDTQFLFALTQLNQHGNNGLVRLHSRRAGLALHVGEKWQFNVKLKHPHGALNPGGFDYEAWSFQAGIIASGYVIDKIPAVMLSNHWYRYPVGRVRQYLYTQLLIHTQHSVTSVWIPALIIGERAMVTSSQWDILRRTGTNHLMAIAGLHIGIMSFFMYAIVSRLWRQSWRLSLWIPSDTVGLFAGLMMTLVYSGLSGFSLPAMRATIMVMLCVASQLYRRHMSMSFAFSSALLIMLLLNPLAILNDSFWLSFGSVALILYGASYRLAPKGLWWKWGRIQWVLGFGLLPFSLLFYQQFSVLSFIANIITIPLVGCIIVPCVLLGTCLLLVSSLAGSFVLHVADFFLALTWKILTYLASWQSGVWHQSIPSVGWILLGLLGVVFILLPIGFPGRALGLVYLLPFLYPSPSTLSPAEIKLTLLDVGQGLSVVVQTQHHLLVYDTGPHFGEYDMGANVVVPYLRTLHADAIDLLVVSHGDNDHIGGYEAIASAFPIHITQTSVPEKIRGSSLCQRGMHWQWDGIDFRYLYPTTDSLELNNDSSCVLRISNGEKTILLTGDIEKAAEKELLSLSSSYLQSNVIIVPHHGSKTSIVPLFLAAVHPDLALIGIGYHNRYHFPHALTVERYHALHALLFDTVKAGAIFLDIKPQDKTLQPSFYRIMHHHYWNDLSAKIETVADS